MNRALVLSLGLLFVPLLAPPVQAQDRVPVVFKAFPPDYELFSGGDRLSYTIRGENLRVYNLPVGTVRVSLSASGSFPLPLALEVKAGMAPVEAKLEPRQGILDLQGTTQTGTLPRAVTFSAGGKRLLVALQGESKVQVFEVPGLKALPDLEFPPSSAGFSDVAVVGPDVWAFQRDGRIHLFDGTTLKYKETVASPRSGHTTVTELGGGKVALAHWDDSVATLFDATAKKSVGAVGVPGSLRGFAAQGATAFGSLFEQGRVAVIDTATWKVKAQWAAGKAPRPVAVLGNRLFVGDMGTAQVLILDTTSGSSVKTISVASNPHQMTVSADRTMVAVASRGRNNPDDYQKAGPEFGKVTVLDSQGQVLASVWGRNQPTGLAFSPDGRFLAFTDYLDRTVELYRITK